mgnify:CR=1 FL=1
MKSLDNFYKLRKDFMIIGLTGKIRSGADLFVDILTQPKLKDEQLKFIKEFQKVYPNISDSESRKLRRITDFFDAETIISLPLLKTTIPPFPFTYLTTSFTFTK